MSAKERRPYSAVSHASKLTEGTEGSEQYYDAIMIDEDESEGGYPEDLEGSEGSYGDGAASQYTVQSFGSHPASHRTGSKAREGLRVKICGERAPKKAFSSYAQVLEKQRQMAGTSHLSVCNTGVYQSQHEVAQQAHLASKKKWMSQTNVDTSMTQTRLQLSHAACGRKMSNWEDVPKYVDVHAGPWKEGNYAATYKFRDLPPLEREAAPFHLVAHKEDQMFKPMANQWEELDAAEAKITELQYQYQQGWEDGSDGTTVQGA